MTAWNMLVPHSGCTSGNISTNYDTYQSLRGGSTEGVALRKEELLPIQVAGAQPPSPRICISP